MMNKKKKLKNLFIILNFTGRKNSILNWSVRWPFSRNHKDIGPLYFILGAFIILIAVYLTIGTSVMESEESNNGPNNGAWQQVIVDIIAGLNETLAAMYKNLAISEAARASSEENLSVAEAALKEQALTAQGEARSDRILIGVMVVLQITLLYFSFS